jgi:uncharacterized protein (DUF2252 family)
MAQSAHAYVRGSTLKFYEWLDAQESSLPAGPSVWICGDCHSGNLGPIASVDGRVDIQIRDLDQTVIGNPAQDLIRLALSLSTAARSSDLPGVTTAHILEQMIEGYCHALSQRDEAEEERPASVGVAMKRSVRRTWKHLAEERIGDVRPTIPLGEAFWPLTRTERRDIDRLFEEEDVRKLVTMLRSRSDGAPVEVMDATYWMKGCSSLGRLRFAVLLKVGKKQKNSLCLIDIKEAVKALAPRARDASMPRDNAERVVTGARHLSPFLGERMLAKRLADRSVFLRELLPQDLKLEFEQLSRIEANQAARFLAGVVGKAHARQMNASMRKSWGKELGRRRSKALDAPSWLWSSVAALVASHETAYLEHCRRYAASQK